MRKTLTLSLVAAGAVVVAGTAYAQTEPRGETTRAEVEQRTSERFAQMDANNDGVLNAADRAAARRAAFDAVDADKDGAISFAEFEAGREARSEPRDADRAEGRGFGRRGAPRGADGPRNARAADADNDGAVTQAEFTGAALARFERADANRDGMISLEERREARQHRRHNMRRGRPAPDAG